MTFATDDIGGMLVSPPAQAVRYGQGTIVSWDNDTFENIIEWRGVLLANLAVLAGTDALTFQQGDTVGLLGWDSVGDKGGSSWWILGRLVIPGPGTGAQVISWMTSALAREIAAQIFADRVTLDFVTETGVHAADTIVWEDIVVIGTGDPSPGPEVVADISESGRAVVITSCSSCVSDTETAQMAFVVDGAASPPTDTSIGTMKANSPTPSLCGNLTAISLVEGLSEGQHTFTAKYRALDQVVPGVTWGDRSILVIGL